VATQDAVLYHLDKAREHIGENPGYRDGILKFRCPSSLDLAVMDGANSASDSGKFWRRSVSRLRSKKIPRKLADCCACEKRLALHLENFGGC